MRRDHGFALGTVLACMVVLVLVLFTAVTATLSHLQAAERVEQIQHAQNLAEAALSETMARLAANDYKALPEGRVEVTFRGLDDAEGIVTFDRSEFPSDYSTYRSLDPNHETSAVGARGRTVPENSVHLVARGRVGDVEQWMECIYHHPPFPEGLIATGKVEASGLYLTGVSLGSAYQGGDGESIAPEDRVPANLFSNSSGLAVTLSANSYVNGSVGAPGEVVLQDGAGVAGELLPGSSLKEMPELDISGKMEVLTRTAYPVPVSQGNLTLPEGWFSHSPSALTVFGDLDLNGSVLCVEGDLKVTGALLGTGFVLVDGDVEVGDGGSDVTGSDQIALAVSGDIQLSAQTPDGNYFKGLIYAEGDVEASDITVVGALVANGKNGRQGAVTQDNVRFIYNPAGVEMNLRGPEGGTFTDGLFAAGDRTYGFSLSIRNDRDSPRAFVAGVDLFVSNKVAKRKKDKKNYDVNQPKTWPVDRTNPGGLPAYTVSREWTFEEAQLSESFLDPLVRELLEGAVAASGAGSNAEYTRALRPDLRKKLLPALKALIDARQDSLELTFNLNNLLREVTASARILLWRPWIRD
ncbi:MAG TPA: hypothetical protein EYO33_12455 [Phycisphaerales bacterium]|nr:hypothetical protein [Phycisphaerales bacterium]